MKLLKQTTEGNTFKHKGETYIMLKNNHYRKVKKGGAKKYSKRRTNKRKTGRKKSQTKKSKKN